MTVLDTVTTRREATRRSPVVGHRSRRLPQRGRLVMLANDIIAASAGTVIVFGWLARAAPGALRRLGGGGVGGVGSGVIAVTLPVAWALALLVFRGYEAKGLGLGLSVNRRIGSAAVTLAAVIPPVCVVVGQSSLVGAAAVTVPLAAVLTMISRRATRVLTVGFFGEDTLTQTLLVGHAGPVFDLGLALRRDHLHTMRVAGVCLIDSRRRELAARLGVPMKEGISGVVGFAKHLGCHVVLVAPSAELDGLRLRRLAWHLHDAGVDLVVAPSLAEAAPRRVTVGEVGDRLLLHVRAARFRGPAWWLKDIVDRVLAVVLTCLSAPVLLAVAIAVRMSSPGPALFRQKRVGRDGKEFVCFKFRTMRVGADSRRDEIAHLNQRSEGLLFKIKDDPRVTRTGSFLRRSSLDELPQLVNVLRGEMSLVGPRPPLPSEVACYDDDVRRRLRVKPGITGLWQVSGRSELPWPEAVRLDLSYVDNWSPSLDVKILVRTAVAVVRGTGAY